MLVTVTGGSGSGKSEFAENVAVSLNKGALVYIATMIPYGEEGRQRVERHRKMRAEKNFQTIECYTNLGAVHVPKGATVLLECISNLTANEVFDNAGAKERAYDSMREGIEHLLRNCRHLVVVTNDIFSDGITYDKEMVRYMKTLGKMNRWLAEKSQRVIEVIYSIPVEKKNVLEEL